MLFHYIINEKKMIPIVCVEFYVFSISVFSLGTLVSSHTPNICTLGQLVCLSDLRLNEYG